MDQHVLFLKTLADPTRLTLLKLLLQEELCVCELQTLLQISQSAVSQHIAKLKNAGLIKERKAGMWTYYRGQHARMRAALDALSHFLEVDPEQIPAMVEPLARMQLLNRAEMCRIVKEEERSK